MIQIDTRPDTGSGRGDQPNRFARRPRLCQRLAQRRFDHASQRNVFFESAMLGGNEELIIEIQSGPHEIPLGRQSYLKIASAS